MTEINKSELRGNFKGIGKFEGRIFRHPEIPFRQHSRDWRDRVLATGNILLNEQTIPINNVRVRQQRFENGRVIYVVLKRGPKGKRDRYVGIVRDERS